MRPGKFCAKVVFLPNIDPSFTRGLLISPGGARPVLRATEPSRSYHFPRTEIKGRTGVDEARATCLNIDNHYPRYAHQEICRTQQSRCGRAE